MGVEFAKAALAVGDKVVATGRQRAAVADALGESASLLVLAMDVNEPGAPEAAIARAVAHFGRIDVLVNNAGYGMVGAFEETSAAELLHQFGTNVFGLAAVTRAMLPLMRQQRAGHILNISSAAGVAGFPGASAYCASKFAVEGLSESLAIEVAPLGIKVTIVEPGYFRTDFLSDSSVVFAATVIDDYDAFSGEMRRGAKALHGQQPGDPRKLAQALLALVAAAQPPLRFNAGADSVGLLEQTLQSKRAELDTWRDLGLSLAHDA